MHGERSSRLSTGGLELGDAFQSLCPQCSGIVRDSNLATALKVRHTTVERRNQLAQVTKCACSVGFTSGFLVGHRGCAVYTSGVEIAIGPSRRRAPSVPSWSSPGRNGVAICSSTTFKR
jgi:hypothetical protein